MFYDDALAAYGILHADGTPQLDANTGTQAAFDNLLILYSGSSLRDDGRTLDYDLSMGGGVWLNGGHRGNYMDAGHPEHPCPLRFQRQAAGTPGRAQLHRPAFQPTGQELLVQSSTGEALVGA